MKNIKITKNIFLIFTVAMVLLSLYVTVFGVIAKKNNELNTFFGYGYSNLTTDIMEGEHHDSIEEGSLYFTKKVNFEKIIVGDIVVYQSTDDTLVVKRVLHLNEDNTITLKADNSEHVKTVIISEDQYQGNVVKSYPFFYLG